MDYLTRYKKPLLKGLVVGISVILAILILADIQSVIRVFTEINISLLPLIIILAPLNYLVRFFKWNFYLKIVGIHPEPRINKLIFMSGLAMTVTPGKVGELLKCYLLKEHMNAPVSQTSSIVMAERITDALSMVVLASLGALIYPYGKIVVPLCAAILIFAVLLFHFDSLFNLITVKLSKFKFLEKRISFLSEFQGRAKKLFSFPNLILAVGMGVISWGFEGFVIYFAVQALGSEITILSSIFVVSFSSLLGALSFLPGGLGVAEGSILTVLVLTGIGRDIAAAATIITRFSTLWLGVAVGILGLLVTQKELSKTKTLNN